jgi:hypothetical protein
MADQPVSFTTGPPETALPEPEPECAHALREAEANEDETARQSACRALVARWPGFLEGWAALADQEATHVARYAYARVGYHRGLDALRAAGWRGSGLVRWAHPGNRGFLRSVDALRAAASDLGEEDEARRCGLLLRQLDPDWPRSGRPPT